jgi:hypothetical protein
VSERQGELGARLACVTFAMPRLLAAFERELALDIPLYGDPDRALYEALGFERGSVARVWLDPRVWAQYVGLVARGRRPRRLKQDTLQLGGDALVDADGRLRWLYRSRGPADRPSVDALSGAIADSLGPVAGR